MKSACVTPIGYVWGDFNAKSALKLYHSDGNHATEYGAFLTALIIYATVMKDIHLNDQKYIDRINIAAPVQAMMRASVADILSTYEPCKYCGN